jgi:hypothetical protein
MGGPQVIAPLVAALDDRDEDVRHAAGMTLAYIGADAVPALVEALGRSPRAARARLGGLGALLHGRGRHAGAARAAGGARRREPGRALRRALRDRAALERQRGLLDRGRQGAREVVAAAGRRPPR